MKKENINKILDLQDVSAAYDDFIALRKVNFSVYENDFIGVIGPNGGGKTTLLKVILGLLPFYEGKIDYLLKGSKANQIGYLPQVTQVDKKFPMSVLNVVLSGLSNTNSIFERTSKEDKTKACDLLTEMEIPHLAKKNIGELSGGQMQRVLLARAIVSNPKLLILDEPNTFVDNKFEYDLYNTLKRLNENMAIIMVSHDVGTISSYVKTIACVNRDLHYHDSNIITEKQLQSYNCPIQIITHGDVPHTVLGKHHHHH